MVQKIFLVAAFIACFAVFEQVKHNFYIFDQNVLHAVAKTAIGSGNRNVSDVVSEVVKGLSAKYPGHINLEDRWVFNNAGGAMGAMRILHASITEYVIIFGTAIGTEGHTGRFFADDYFIILDGEQWAFEAGQMTPSVFKPGDMNLMPAFTARGYRMPAQGWALEYARGNIPSMLPFGIMDTFTSTLDLPTLWSTFEIYAKRVVTELLQGKI
jgi:C-8 sterol isomerase